MRRALDTLRLRSPESYLLVAGCIERAPARYAVGGERFTVDAGGGRVGVRSGWRPTVASRIETTPEALLALFDGTATVEQLLAAESLVVMARADALLDLSEAIGLFAAEAASAPVYVRQFEEYRAWALGR